MLLLSSLLVLLHHLLESLSAAVLSRSVRKAGSQLRFLANLGCEFQI